MSDFFIKTAGSGSTGWRKMSNLFVKTAGSGSTGWKAAIRVFLRNSGGWLRVWPLSGVFAETNPFIVENQNDTRSSRITTAIRIGTTYYGKNGTWDPNGWTINSYTHSWPYYPDSTSSSSGNFGSSGTYTAPVSLSITSAANATLLDNKFIAFSILANASNSNYSSTAISERVKVVRSLPTNTTFTLSAGPYSIGTQITLTSTWNSTEARKIDSTRTTVKWYKVSSLSNISSSGTRTEITRVSGSYNFTPQESDNVNGFYIVAEETVFNSGTDYDYGSGGIVNGSNQKTIATDSVVAVYPGNLSSVEQYNFNPGQSIGFFTTGTNTTSVQYKFDSTNISSFTIPTTGTFTQNTSSSLPYKIQQNLLSYFTSRTWNNDTYSAGTTYTKGSLVWFAGNRYEGKDVGFSGFLPTNTTYWTLSSTTANQWSSSTSYSSGNIVWYQGAVYQAGLPSTNIAPTVGGDYWEFQYSFANTYNSGTTYFQNNSVNYNGSTYAAKAISWSNQTPPNSTYWSVYQTVTYNPGDYVLYNSIYYFCRSTTNGTYPSNTTFWSSGVAVFTMTATPYNGTLAGTTSALAPQTISIRADGASSDPLRISLGPTFSNVTKTAFRSTFTPSSYANRAIIDIRSGGSSITNYPRELTVSGATETTHDTVTTLTKNTTYAVTVQGKYMYNSTYSVFHNGETTPSTNVTTLPDAPGAFSISSATKAYGSTARQVAISWGTSADATSYSYFIEGSDNGTTWATVTQSGTGVSVTYANTSTTSTSVAINVTKYRYYRVSVRAFNSGGNTDASNNGLNATGTAPGDPTIGTITVGATQVSVSYTNSSTVGSADIIGVQYKIGSGGSWSSNQTSSPFTFNNPAAGSYTLYLRSINDDQLTSNGDANGSFTVSQQPNSFTYTISNNSSVTSAQAPSQQRVSSTSNSVLIELTPASPTSAKPSDTAFYDVYIYGTGSAAGGTLASPAQSTVVTLNEWSSSGTYVGGQWDQITNIASGASNSPISIYTIATGTSRTLNANVSTTTGAASWSINYTISGASGGNGTYNLNTNSMPITIATITGATNPTVTINSVTAYSGTNQTGATRSGTAGTTTSLSNIARPTSTSSTTTNNWTYVLPNLITNPAYGAATSTSTGFTASISTQPNPTGGTYTYISSTNGSATVNASSGAVTASIPTAGQSATVTVRYSASGYNPVNITVTGTRSSNVAPSGGFAGPLSVTGTGGRVGATYTVTIEQEASGTPSPTKSYQWQHLNNQTSTWNNIDSATSSSYTIPWTYFVTGVERPMPGTTIRCLVTWTNTAGSQSSASGSASISNPTITGVTVDFSNADPFVLYRCYGYNFRSIASTLTYGSTTPPTTVGSVIYSQSGNSTIPITRQSGQGGTLFYYFLKVTPYSTVGTGSVPVSPVSIGSEITTTTLRNTLANRDAGFINTFGTGSA